MSDDFDRAVPRLVTRRLIPLLGLTYVLAHLDRVNVSFAALTMNADLGFTETVYGLGAGLFFLGYFLFEVPSNVALERVGARRLITVIMMVWGTLSAGMALVTGPVQFYVMRFLLGLAEAGLYPGIMLYLTYWYRDRDRAGAVGLFALALAVAGLIGSPLSGWILDTMDGLAGLTGWQWLFIVEGLPSVGLAAVVWLSLPDRPAQATGLARRSRNGWSGNWRRPGRCQPRLGMAVRWRQCAILPCSNYRRSIFCFWAPSPGPFSGPRSWFT